MRYPLLCAGLVLLSACAPSVDQTPSTGSMSTDAGLTGSDYVVIDLTTGEQEPRVSLADPAGNPAYRTTHMAFRRMPAGTTSMGLKATGIGENDEWTQAVAKVGWTWVAVFELTRGQWRRLGGADEDGQTPLDDALPAVVHPASLLSVLGSARNAHLNLDIPTDAEWTRAASAGADTAYGWGDSLLDSDVSSRAVVQPHAGSSLTPPTGPAAVGGLLPNAWGLYDMQGNVWEIVSSGAEHDRFIACGGCWRQGVVQTRRTNRLTLAFDTTHPLVGARLVRR